MIVLFGSERALLSNGLGRSDEAMAAAQIALDHSAFGGTGAGTDRADRGRLSRRQPRGARQPGSRSSPERTRLSGTDWALGVEARLRALLHEGQQAEDLYREALDLLGRTGVLPRRGEPASRTASGCGARTVASKPVRTCARPTSCFSTMGAGAFAERARRELMATGETDGSPPRRHRAIS